MTRADGVLILLRGGDSLPAEPFPLLARGDGASARGAIVVARFAIGEAVHGVTLDSGAVVVQREGGFLSVRARGSGVEIAGSGRVMLDARFEAVPLGRGRAHCEGA